MVLRKFEDFYVGATNEIYERYKFNSEKESNTLRGSVINSAQSSGKKL